MEESLAGYHWMTLGALALLGYCMVTCMLVVLASQRRKELEVHDRVRISRQMRLDYLRSLEERKAASDESAHPPGAGDPNAAAA